MKRAIQSAECSAVSDLSIVDTFTKLIFGESDGYSNQELKIIQALRHVDDNVSLDNHRQMGEYLRALGVREMIALVERVQQQMLLSSRQPPQQAAQASAASSRNHLPA
ncbi:MAG: hypothetical protein AAGI11_06000 [Pseudomonadota bacterium]